MTCLDFEFNPSAGLRLPLELGFFFAHGADLELPVPFNGAVALNRVRTLHQLLVLTFIADADAILGRKLD